LIVGGLGVVERRPTQVECQLDVGIRCGIGAREAGQRRELRGIGRAQLKLTIAKSEATTRM